MKVLFLLFACSFYMSGMRQTVERNNQNIVTLTYMPLDSVPNWVKTNVSSEEYGLWQRLSHYYQVDYSILREDLSPEQEVELYRMIRQTLADIESGNISSPDLYGYYTFSPLPKVDTNLSWSLSHLTQIDSNLFLVNKQAPIYYAGKEGQYRVVCSIWYLYDKSQQKATVLKSKFGRTGDCSDLPNIVGNVEFLSDKGILQGSCAGTLDYVDLLGHNHVENINVIFVCPLSFN